VKLDEIVDRMAIQDLITSHSVNAGRLDAAAIVANFTEDVVLRGISVLCGRPDVDLVGRDAIAELFAETFSSMVFLQQLSQVTYVRIEGNIAQARAMVRECGLFRGQDMTIMMGNYEDEFLRTAEGWRFKKRSFTLVALGQTAVNWLMLPGAG